ncbi:alpha/beta fold hydrolase [Streptomonospora wellingtoniae]|uniref:Alpha/beta hydrolase n=1 Tax=Streptomonospora wellingtoniae TaxID=3075544 RepID=A0ABU2KY21_9ACTN|nr:alpha/beta hydrolase [Streptomonospora sp. DSM 45055]MDT0304155.1 alpha/beta hydrolase [Streptomonospora sp. DSM 45055]
MDGNASTGDEKEVPGEATEAASPHPKRRRRWTAWAVAALLLVAVGCWAAAPDGPPVGHFTSARGHDRFFAAYERAMAEFPEPDATLDLRTDYGVVRMYRFDGADSGNAPLVLLPGRASASPMFAGNLPSLLEIGTVYTVDLIGEPGASIQTRPIRDGADQALWLHEALSQLPEPEVNLLGVSIGGWAAMNLAVRQPDTVASATLVDPAMTFADIPLETAVRSIPATVSWTPDSWREDFNSWTAGGAPVKDLPVAKMIESGMENYAARLPLPNRFSADRLGSAATPVLVIIAGQSVMHDPDEAARNAQETLIRGTVLTYDDASHAASGEYPGEIAADVADFLSDVES